MNMMGYDAMALGPKELSLGLEVLRDRMGEARFAVLSANAALTETGELLAPPYAVREVGGRRIGILGLTRDELEPGGEFAVLEPRAALERYLPELAVQVEWVVVVTNLPYKQGLALAAEVPGIDLLVAALPGQLPTQAVRVPGTGTIVVTAEQSIIRHSGRRVGRLLLAEGEAGLLEPASWSSVSMDASFADDLLMGSLLESFAR
jgi:2',3'-cyclic-nucleotide 2'-phosphodiesterase (5'-nucleotidase family)